MPLTEIHPEYFKIPSADQSKVKELYENLLENNEDIESAEKDLKKEDDTIKDEDSQNVDIQSSKIKINNP